MRPLPYYILAVSPLALIPSLASGFGNTGGLLMAEGLAVRAQGLGLAYSALADDEASLQSNPAGLAQTQDLALGAGQMLGLLDERVSLLQAAWRATSSLGLGLQAAYAGSEDEGRDAFGVPQGRFSNNELLLGAGLGLSPAPGWRLGLALKALAEDLGGGRSQGLALDAGVQADLPRGWSAGASVLNAGVQRWEGGAELATPLRVQAGVATPSLARILRVETGIQALPLENQARLLLGAELDLPLSTGPADRAALRAGLQAGLLREGDTRLSLGAGLGLGPRLRLDYALAELGALGLAHRLGLGLRLPTRILGQGPRGADLPAPWGVEVSPQTDGLMVAWSYGGPEAQGFNLYSDYGVLVERLNPAPVGRTRQRFIRVERSRTYNFYVRAVGSDGQEGPPSEVKTVRVR